MSDSGKAEDKPVAQATEQEPETDMTAAEEVGLFVASAAQANS